MIFVHTIVLEPSKDEMENYYFSVFSFNFQSFTHQLLVFNPQWPIWVEGIPPWHFFEFSDVKAKRKKKAIGLENV